MAIINHRGIDLTSKLTDFSGYLIFAVSVLLTLVLLVFAPTMIFHACGRSRIIVGMPAAGSGPPTAVSSICC